ncbi:MAG: glycosyltransferase, partial [Cutibacterium avidum]|nr:glycosyltransferase [Cutibacterium avidum]
MQRATGDDHPSAASRTVEGAWSTDSPAVSVVVPHYGEVEPTMSVVRDLMAQEGVDSFEIIVSDDCSPQTFPEGEGWKVVHGAANGG